MSRAQVQAYLKVKPGERKDPQICKQLLLILWSISDYCDITNKVTFSDTKKKKNHKFEFTGVFPTDISQIDVFKKVGLDISAEALEGINSTIFAYGQTGSGKTYTMTGPPGVELNEENGGLIYNILSYLFQKKRNETSLGIQVKVQFVEIYNEQIFDLLSNKKQGYKIPLKLDYFGGGKAVLRGATTHQIESIDSALMLLSTGSLRRHMRQTKFNKSSSRGHTIFTILVSSQKFGADYSKLSKINLVDLAGAENATAVDGRGREAQLESTKINLSLLSLRRMIEGQPGADRASEMTKLLLDSIGGNCITKMITTINPSNVYSSLDSCRVARQMMCKINLVKANQVEDTGVIIKRLQNKIEDLEKALKTASEFYGCKYLMPDQEVFVKDDVDRFIKEENDETLQKMMCNAGSVKTAMKYMRNKVLAANQKVKEAAVAGAVTDSTSALQKKINDLELKNLELLEDIKGLEAAKQSYWQESEGMKIKFVEMTKRLRDTATTEEQKNIVDEIENNAADLVGVSEHQLQNPQEIENSGPQSSENTGNVDKILEAFEAEVSRSKEMIKQLAMAQRFVNYEDLGVHTQMLGQGDKGALKGKFEASYYRSGEIKELKEQEYKLTSEAHSLEQKAEIAQLREGTEELVAQMETEYMQLISDLQSKQESLAHLRRQFEADFKSFERAQGQYLAKMHNDPNQNQKQDPLLSKVSDIVEQMLEDVGKELMQRLEPSKSNNGR